MNLAGDFLTTLAAHGDAPAITEPKGQPITYADLYRQTRALAADLCDRGLQPGDAVLIQIPNGIAFAVAVVAVLAAGGVAILCEPGLGDEVYRARLRSVGARWVLVHPMIQWANRIPGARRFLQRREVLVPPLLSRAACENQYVVSSRTLMRLAQHARITGEPAAVVPRSAADDAIIIFTGGTTSMPKGVRLSHGALRHYLGNIQGIAEELEISRFLADTPQQVLYALSLGKQVLVTKGRTQRRARFVLQAIRDGRIDAYFGSPFLWVEMMAQGGQRGGPLPATLRAVLLGGAPVTPDFLRSLRAWLHPDSAVRALYGLTEAGPVCVAADEEKCAWEGEGDFVGHPLPGVKVQIEPMEGRTEGQVIVYSDALYTGYTGQSPRGEEEGLATGDLGRLVESGGHTALVLLGRKKDMIIRQGINIYPPLFEPAINAMRDDKGQPLIRDCALIGLWSPDSQDEVVVLCYELAAGAQATPEQIGARVDPITGVDAAPDHYLAFEKLPVTGRQNKLDKAAIKTLAAGLLGLYPAPVQSKQP